MALTTERRNELAQMNLPSEEAMRKRLRSFNTRTGLTMHDLADMSGYSFSAIRLFMTGNYDRHHAKESNTLALRAALKHLIDKYEVEQKVHLDGPHYETSTFVDLRRSILNAMRRGTAYLVDGPPGTGKTHALRRVEHEINSEDLGHAVYVYARQGIAPGSFLTECCIAAGIPSRGQIDQLLRKLRFFLGGQKRVVLLVDEAQHLDHSGLEVLRQLLDLPPYFGVVLAGSHDLSQRLSHWQMEQWRSRLRKKHYLDGLTRDEAKDILRGELRGLPAATVSQIVDGCRSQASRNGNKFDYISARDLFFAIEATKQQLDEAREAAQSKTQKGSAQ